MDWAVIIVALISGGCGLISSIIVAKTSSEKMLHQLEMNQAVQNERMATYQKSTNEKIDELRSKVEVQGEYGTKIALLEQRVSGLEGRLGHIE